MLNEEAKVPTTLVIGATGELGAAVAKRFGTAGHALVVHGWSRTERLTQVAIDSGAFETVTADMTDEKQVVALFAGLETLDNVVYCAGINPTAGKVRDLDVVIWRQILDVNLAGAFLCVKHSIPLLQASAARQPHKMPPAIVLVSSIFGIETPARRSAYGASKHGLTALVQAVTKEEGDWLRINAVCPGPMWSENLRHIVERHAAAEDVSVEDYILSRVRDIPAGRLMDLDECAAVIEFLCSSESAFIRGESIRISGGAVE